MTAFLVDYNLYLSKPPTKNLQLKLSGNSEVITVFPFGNGITVEILK